MSKLVPAAMVADDNPEPHPTHEQLRGASGGWWRQRDECPVSVDTDPDIQTSWPADDRSSGKADTTIAFAARPP